MRGRSGVKTPRRAHIRFVAVGDASGRPEADASMAAVAEWLGLATAATAEVGLGHARDHTSGAARDLEIATHAQRPVQLRVDRKRSVAGSQHFGVLRPSLRLTAGSETSIVM